MLSCCGCPRAVQGTVRLRWRAPCPPPASTIASDGSQIGERLEIGAQFLKVPVFGMLYGALFALTLPMVLTALLGYALDLHWIDTMSQSPQCTTIGISQRPAADLIRAPAARPN
jgi:hypothetical protein